VIDCGQFGRRYWAIEREKMFSKCSTRRWSVDVKMKKEAGKINETYKSRSSSLDRWRRST
jgi:hypothetical protein